MIDTRLERHWKMCIALRREAPAAVAIAAKYFESRRASPTTKIETKALRFVPNTNVRQSSAR